MQHVLGAEKTQELKEHLSEHYGFYKATSIALIGAGALLNIEVIGYTWPSISEKVANYLFDRTTIVSKSMQKLGDFSIKVCESLFDKVDFLLENLTSSYLINGAMIATASAIIGIAIGSFLIINSPSFVAAGLIGGVALGLPLIPGTLISVSGMALWQLTEKSS